MRLYTGLGDQGTSRLLDGSEVAKNDPRLEAYGALDELNSHIGFARSLGISEGVDKALEAVQSLLLELGATLDRPSTEICRITDVDISNLEAEIDRATESCPPLRSFILPAGSSSVCALHVARAVCRRAERAMVALHNKAPLHANALCWMNRLSDLLFAYARLCNAENDVADFVWHPREGR